MDLGLCAAPRALGDVATWYNVFSAPDEVYVFRAIVGGATIAEPADALAILRAVAEAQPLHLDARAIAVKPLPQGGTQIDVVMTADSHMVYAQPNSAPFVAEQVSNDPDLRARFPTLVLSSPTWLELTGPADAVDFWRAHAVVYDDTAGLTQAFAQGQGAYQGRADDGPRALPWAGAPPPLGDRPPTIPSYVLVLLAGTAAAAVVFVGARLLTDQRRYAA